jgi:hypothetical protein
MFDVEPMKKDNILMSLKPENLAMADIDPDIGIELKLDWKHVGPKGAVSEDSQIRDLAKDSDVDPERIRSVHLPPGTSNSRGMTANRDNIGSIVDFSFNQMAGMQSTYMTTHPPKDFNYEEQARVMEDICQLSQNDVSIENTSVDSDWYDPEEIAFFAFLGHNHEGLDSMYLTIDSAHLPQGEDVSGHFDITSGNYYTADGEISETMAETEVPLSTLFDVDYDVVSDLDHKLREEDRSIPPDYFSFVGSNLENYGQQYVTNGDNLVVSEALSGDRYTPLLRTLFMTGTQVKSVHLNDPYTNSVPTPEDIQDSTGLDTALEYMTEHSIYGVLEPEEAFDRQDIREWTDNLSS